MANEVTTTHGIQIANSSAPNADFSMQKVYQHDQINPGTNSPGTQVIGTSEEEVNLDELTDCGWILILNLDPTNYVEVGPDSGGSMVPMVTVAANSAAGPFELKSAVTLKAKAYGGACKVMFIGNER